MLRTRSIAPLCAAVEIGALVVSKKVDVTVLIADGVACEARRLCPAASG